MGGGAGETIARANEKRHGNLVPRAFWRARKGVSTVRPEETVEFTGTN